MLQSVYFVWWTRVLWGHHATLFLMKRWGPSNNCASGPLKASAGTDDTHTAQEPGSLFWSGLWSRNSNFRLRFQNDLIHWNLNTILLFVQLARLPHKLCLWNWNPNFRLWLYHLKVFGSGSNHPTVLRLGSGSTALILVSCSCEFAVHSCPLLCLQKQVAKLAKGFFNCWSLLRNSTMAINLQSSLEATVVGVLPHVTVEVERRRLGG